jgi:hypothetical protein
MKTSRHPWQELLESAIKNKTAPPRPPDFYTREEIAKLWNKKVNTANRFINLLIAQKKVEVIRHQSVIPTKGGPITRKLQMFRIIPTKSLHK